MKSLYIMAAGVLVSIATVNIIAWKRGNMVEDIAAVDVPKSISDVKDGNPKMLYYDRYYVRSVSKPSKFPGIFLVSVDTVKVEVMEKYNHYND